ncbi:MAG: hypothetical protein IPH57_01225 [Saprospiraceae bacterium]|jgi:uncharacterized membrane protein|nr:hypothetical protein [Saprospiraceae bacterium]
MAITYNKKGFKRRYKLMKLGKEKYSFVISFLIAFFFASGMTVFNYFMDDEKSLRSFIFPFFFYLIFMFVFNYFVYKSQWSQEKRDINETIEYWEKNDPAFFQDQKFEKIE